jgi:hypothetical protein
MTDNDDVEEHYDEFFPFISFSPFFHSILSHSRRLDSMQKEELSAFCCSFLFASFFVFHFFCFSPSRLTVGFSKSPLHYVAYRACAHTTSNIVCQSKQQQRSSQTHTLSTQCNHFRQLGAHNYNRNYTSSYFALTVIWMCTCICLF